MRKYTALAIITLALFYVESCAPKPFACFIVEPDEENIHVGDSITFRASCTTGADAYFWEFYDKDDSTEYGFLTTRKFYQPGEVKVFLLVTGSGKTSATSRYITVKP